MDVVVAMGGAVDPLDEGVVVAHLLQYFQGCAWCYSQPKGYDTYDLTDVVIMGKNVMDPDASLTEAQAKAIIAQHGCASSGRIPISTFDRLLGSKYGAPHPPGFARCRWRHRVRQPHLGPF